MHVLPVKPLIFIIEERMFFSIIKVFQTGLMQIDRQLGLKDILKVLMLCECFKLRIDRTNG